MPSVTSLGPYGHGYRAGPLPPPYGLYPSRPAFGHGRRSAYGSFAYGGGYAVPYYVPAYDSSYGYDSGGGGPYLYSGLPAEQTLHIVVDLPPSKYAADPDGDDEAMGLPAAPLQHREADAAPLDATVLVFRDGHQQEVSNYAIMGQTLYIFDGHRQKIGVSDLDIPATIRLNDDRGVDFHLPNQKQG